MHPQEFVGKHLHRRYPATHEMMACVAGWVGQGGVEKLVEFVRVFGGILRGMSISHVVYLRLA